MGEELQGEELSGPVTFWPIQRGKTARAGAAGRTAVFSQQALSTERQGRVLRQGRRTRLPEREADASCCVSHVTRGSPACCAHTLPPSTTCRWHSVQMLCHTEGLGSIGTLMAGLVHPCHTAVRHPPSCMLPKGRGRKKKRTPAVATTTASVSPPPPCPSCTIFRC